MLEAILVGVAVCVGLLARLSWVLRGAAARRRDEVLRDAADEGIALAEQSGAFATKLGHQKLSSGDKRRVAADWVRERARRLGHEVADGEAQALVEIRLAGAKK